VLLLGLEEEEEEEDDDDDDDDDEKADGCPRFLEVDSSK